MTTNQLNRAVRVDGDRDEMRRSIRVAAIDYCDSTHKRALLDANLTLPRLAQN
jgi:hypothetical protein